MSRTTPSASCAPGVPANQCLVAPTADTEGELDDDAAGAHLLLSLDELVFFVRDVASFSPDTHAYRCQFLPAFDRHPLLVPLPVEWRRFPLIPCVFPNIIRNCKRSRRYLPVVHAVLEEIQDLVAVTTMENMQDEVMPPSISSQMIFKHWCRSELPAPSGKLLCPRYVDRLKQSDGVWQTIHEQLQVRFLSHSSHISLHLSQSLTFSHTSP